MKKEEDFQSYDYKIDRGELLLNRMSRNQDYATVIVRSLKRAELYSSELGALTTNIYDVFRELGILYSSNLINSIMQIAVDLFDEFLVDYIDMDLKDFRRENNITEKNTNNRALAIVYYKNYISNPQSLSKHLTAKFPLFLPQFRLIQENFFNHIKLMLERVKYHKHAIANLFFNDDQSITLNMVYSSGSDLHRNGQNVLVLEFLQWSNTKKIVYKPTSIRADAVLIGDLNKLSEVLPDYSIKKSIIEIFNEKLEQNLKFIPLVVLPLVDFTKAKEPFLQEFGFIEFIGSDRWCSSPREAMEDELSLLLPSQRKPSETPQQIYYKSFKQFVLQEAKDESCCFIAHSEKEVKNYSFQCGILISMMLMFGIADSHCENLIVDRRAGGFCTPRLIDCEVCFAPLSPTIKNLTALHVEIGSMRSNSKSAKKFEFLFDIFGKYTKNILLYEKNSLLLALPDSEQITQCDVDSDSIIDGFWKGLSILLNKKIDIQSWLSSVAVKGLCTRHISYSTYELKLRLDQLIKNQMTFNAFNEYVKTFLEGDLAFFASEYNDYRRNASRYANLNDFFNVFCSPALSIWTSSTSGMYSQLLARNIPVYYALVDSTDIFDADGNKIKFLEVLRQYFPDHKGDSYFSISPLKFIKNRIEQLLTDKEVLEWFIIETRKDIGTFLKSDLEDKRLMIVKFPSNLTYKQYLSEDKLSLRF